MKADPGISQQTPQEDASWSRPHQVSEGKPSGLYTPEATTECSEAGNHILLLLLLLQSFGARNAYYLSRGSLINKSM